MQSWLGEVGKGSEEIDPVVLATERPGMTQESYSNSYAWQDGTDASSPPGPAGFRENYSYASQATVPVTSNTASITRLKLWTRPSRPSFNAVFPRP